MCINMENTKYIYKNNFLYVVFPVLINVTKFKRSIVKYIFYTKALLNWVMQKRYFGIQI